jgi:CBS domain-containing protein
MTVPLKEIHTNQRRGGPPDVDEGAVFASEILREATHEARHLPVLHAHTLVGVISDRDVKQALDPEVRLPPRDELFVRDVYVPEPYAVDASTRLDTVLEYMATDHVGSALVTKHRRLAGIFTATDACQAYCEHLRTLFPSRSGAVTGLR